CRVPYPQGTVFRFEKGPDGIPIPLRRQIILRTECLAVVNIKKEARLRLHPKCSVTAALHQLDSTAGRMNQLPKLPRERIEEQCAIHAPRLGQQQNSAVR